jgi:uncharacterized protein YbaR (Trm112 family)
MSTAPIRPGTRLVCPRCNSDDNLWSCERAEIMYPVTYSAGGGVDYTGGRYEVNDESTSFEGVLYCRNCTTELSTAQLVADAEDDSDQEAQREFECPTDEQVVNAIAARLSNAEWRGADDLDHIADLIRSTGREVKDVAQ